MVALAPSRRRAARVGQGAAAASQVPAVANDEAHGVKQRAGPRGGGRQVTARGSSGRRWSTTVCDEGYSQRGEGRGRLQRRARGRRRLVAPSAGCHQRHLMTRWRKRGGAAHSHGVCGAGWQEEFRKLSNALRSDNRVMGTQLSRTPQRGGREPQRPRQHAAGRYVHVRVWPIQALRVRRPAGGGGSIHRFALQPMLSSQRRPLSPATSSSLSARCSGVSTSLHSLYPGSGAAPPPPQHLPLQKQQQQQQHEEVGCRQQ